MTLSLILQPWDMVFILPLSTPILFPAPCAPLYPPNRATANASTPAPLRNVFWNVSICLLFIITSPPCKNHRSNGCAKEMTAKFQAFYDCRPIQLWDSVPAITQIIFIRCCNQPMGGNVQMNGTPECGFDGALLPVIWTI